MTHNTLYMEMMLKKFSSSDVEETKYPYNGVDPQLQSMKSCICSKFILYRSKVFLANFKTLCGLFTTMHSTKHLAKYKREE